MKNVLFLLPFLFVLGCHPLTPKDESFVAYVSAKTFMVCDDKFLFSSTESNRFCSCLAKKVAENTRNAKTFDRKSFVKAEKKVLPTPEQKKECLNEAVSP